MANDKLVTRLPLPLSRASQSISTECCVTFDEENVLLRVEGHEPEEDVSPLDNAIEITLAGYFDA